MNKDKPFILQHGYVERISCRPTTDTCALAWKRDAEQYWEDGEFETLEEARKAAREGFAHTSREGAYEIIYMIMKGESWDEEAEEWEDYAIVEDFDFYAEGLKQEWKERQDIVVRLIMKVLTMVSWDDCQALVLLKALRLREYETDVDDILNRDSLEAYVVEYLGEEDGKQAMELLDVAIAKCCLDADEVFAEK